MTILDEAVALAGVDPRLLHQRLMAGRPDRMVELMRAFEEAGHAAGDSYRRDQRAHATVAAGFGNDGVAVLDAGGADRDAFRLLGRGGQDMEGTAGLLRRAVGALESAQSTSTAVVDRMVRDLNGVAAAWSQRTAADPAAGPAERQRYLAEAAAVVRTAADQVQREIDGYDRVLDGGAAELAGRGYRADPQTVARYEGAVAALPTLPALPPPGSPDRAVSPVNGALTGADALAGGTTGALLETSAGIRTADALARQNFHRSELARLRGQTSVPDADGFYRDLDHHSRALQQADDALRQAGTVKRAATVTPIKISGALAVAGIGYDIATGKDPVQAVAAGAGGFAASVATGAAIGTLVGGPAGTVLGAVGGAVVGTFTSGMIDGLFEDGPDVGAAFHRGLDTVGDSAKALGHGIASLFD